MGTMKQRSRGSSNNNIHNLNFRASSSRYDVSKLLPMTPPDNSTYIHHLQEASVASTSYFAKTTNNQANHLAGAFTSCSTEVYYEDSILDPVSSTSYTTEVAYNKICHLTSAFALYSSKVYNEDSILDLVDFAL